MKKEKYCDNDDVGLEKSKKNINSNHVRYIKHFGEEERKRHDNFFAPHHFYLSLSLSIQNEFFQYSWFT